MELLGVPASQVHEEKVGVRYEGHSVGMDRADGTDADVLDAPSILSHGNVSEFFSRNGSFGSFGHLFADDPDPSTVAGVGKNSLSDLPTLGRALFIYSSLLLLGIILFHYLRSWYPLVYCYNDLQAVVPDTTKDPYTNRRSEILNEVPESLQRIETQRGLA